MIYKELYRQSKETLQKAGLESPAFDAMCLFEKVCGMNRHDLIMNGTHAAAPYEEKQLTEITAKRANHVPLQYLLGKWSFMDCRLFVGDGVLIPREDTETVVNLCIETINKQFGADKCKELPLSIIDLCAGSGAIGIALAKKFPQANILAVEKSPAAFEYLKKNINHNKTANVMPIAGDIFTHYKNYTRESFDVIISNPPYIIADEIPHLQLEVQQEPAMALNGGKDGYDFYKAITAHWSPLLKSGGIITFELGEGQYETVKTFLEEENFTQITFANDFGNIKRGISGIKNSREK